MQELLDQLWRIRTKSEQYGRALEAKLNTNSNDIRCACFPMIFNKCTLNIELLDFYRKLWGRPYTIQNMNPEQANLIFERTKKENWERCIEQTKSLFIGVMSSIEFCAKQTVKLYSVAAIGQAISKIEAKRHVYLNDIIQESNKIGLLSAAEKYKWERLIRLRNSFVHNNGVAEVDETYTVDAVTIILVNGKMIQGKLDIFTNLVESSLDLYNEWINKILS